LTSKMVSEHMPGSKRRSRYSRGGLTGTDKITTEKTRGSNNVQRGGVQRKMNRPSMETNTKSSHEEFCGSKAGVWGPKKGQRGSTSHSVQKTVAVRWTENIRSRRQGELWWSPYGGKCGRLT